jgi:hypothetical protein
MLQAMVELAAASPLPCVTWNVDHQRWPKRCPNGVRRRPVSMSGVVMAAEDESRTAAPGDITISTSPNGYLIGRMHATAADGGAWEFLTAVRDRQRALRMACELAAGQHTVWILETQEGNSVPLDCTQVAQDTGDGKHSQE